MVGTEECEGSRVADAGVCPHDNSDGGLLLVPMCQALS